jgi:cobalamin biosynthetic protein CobC
MHPPRDHGGGLDAAASAFGGAREDWLDLSTGINPIAYPLGTIPEGAWTALPDRAAMDRFTTAARSLLGAWPDGAEIIAAPGASALIARLPGLLTGQRVRIEGPTYNEHAAAFEAAGWTVAGDGVADASVSVHPNNPDGRRMAEAEIGQAANTIIDESFCDTCPRGISCRACSDARGRPSSRVSANSGGSRACVSAR